MGARLGDVGMETGIGNAVLRALEVFALASDHPELEHAPIFMEGYSWGGQFGYHFTVWRPDRVLGFMTMKGGFHRTFDAGDAIQVPGYLFAGENDKEYRVRNLSQIFERHRPLGAKWALAILPGVGHGKVHDRDLLDPWFRAVVEARLPPGEPSLFEPPLLQNVSEESGWLGDNDDFVVASWLDYTGSVDRASWLLNCEVGQRWRAAVSNSFSAVSHSFIVESCLVGTQSTRPVFDGSFNVMVVVRYDNNPLETSWAVRALDGGAEQFIYVGNDEHPGAGQALVRMAQLDPGDYQFVILDEGVDGIDAGGGYFAIYVNDVLVASGGGFGKRKKVEFSV